MAEVTAFLNPVAWRQAWRSLRRRPAFLVSAVLTLGFGTGITAAVFSLVDTVLVKPLPFPDGDQLVTVYESSASLKQSIGLIAPIRVEDWQRLSESFVAVSGSYGENVTDTSGAEPERLEGRRVQPRFFTVFGMLPIAGRHFTGAEEVFGGPGAAIISERFWTRRFQRSPAAIGRALNIGGRSYEIVGVMPSTFTPAATDVWLPSQTPPGLLRVRDARFIQGVGRLKPDIAIDAAQRELTSVQEALARDFPKTDAGWSAHIRSLKEARIGDAGNGLVIVLAAVVSLWVIAVANIAGLTLVQMQRRGRELALRVALGASRARVVGTVIREGLLIAVAGGGLGALLTGWLLTLMPTVLTRTPRINEVALDWRALAVVAVTSVLAACAFSLIPAIASTRATLNPSLATGNRSTGGHHRLQRILVVAQVALSVLLVGSATLLLRSYYNLTRIDTGFDPSSVITFHVGARWDEDRTRIGRLQQDLLAKLEQLPYVQSAGLTNFFPASGATLRYEVTVTGLSGPNQDGSMSVGTRMIGGGYFRAIRAQLVAGSSCPDLALSGSGSPLTALVNQRFVETFAGGQDLVGRTVAFARAGGGASFTIAGIVGNLAEDGHASAASPYVYTCSPAGAWPDPEYVVQTSNPRALTAELRRIVGEIEPGRAVFGVRPLQEVLDAALDQPRLDAAMLSLFASAAVTLAAIGLYSLFMLIVSERSREMALRLAIGAEPRQLIQLVMAGAGRLLAAGLLLGVGLTLAADKLLRGVLFGVSPFDGVALAAATLVLALVATLAVAVPALKAARIAPVDALRGD